MLCCVFDGPNLQDSSYPVASPTNDGDDDNDDDYIRRAKCAYLGIAKMLQNITTGVQFTLWIRTVTTCFLLEWRAFRGFSHPFFYRPPPPEWERGDDPARSWKSRLIRPTIYPTAAAAGWLDGPRTHVVGPDGFALSRGVCVGVWWPCFGLWGSLNPLLGVEAPKVIASGEFRASISDTCWTNGYQRQLI